MPWADVADAPEGTFFAAWEEVGPVADERAVEDVVGFDGPFVIDAGVDSGFAVEALDAAETLLTFLLPAEACL